MNYEVLDLFEVGSAGLTILEKGIPALDEIMEPMGVQADALEE